MTGDPISKKTLARLPLYLGYLREQKGGDQPYISATTIADALGLNQVQVRKDLALISSGGKPEGRLPHQRAGGRYRTLFGI